MHQNAETQDLQQSGLPPKVIYWLKDLLEERFLWTLLGHFPDFWSIPDISLTDVKFPHIPRFFSQVFTLYR